MNPLIERLQEAVNKPLAIDEDSIGKRELEVRKLERIFLEETILPQFHIDDHFVVETPEDIESVSANLRWALREKNELAPYYVVFLRQPKPREAEQKEAGE